jgi:hypothetical protein
MLKWIFNYYNQSTPFHSFVQGMLGALIAALTSWQGGVPLNMGAFYALLAFLGKALFAWFTRWAQTQQATKAVSTTAK